MLTNILHCRHRKTTSPHMYLIVNILQHRRTLCLPSEAETAGSSLLCCPSLKQQVPNGGETPTGQWGGRFVSVLTCESQRGLTDFIIQRADRLVSNQPTRTQERERKSGCVVPQDAAHQLSDTQETLTCGQTLTVVFVQKFDFLNIMQRMRSEQLDLTYRKLGSSPWIQITFILIRFLHVRNTDLNTKSLCYFH